MGKETGNSSAETEELNYTFEDTVKTELDEDLDQHWKRELAVKREPEENIVIPKKRRFLPRPSNVEGSGDARKLYSHYNRQEGVYEKTSIMLFKENHVVHRSSLWKMWNSNKCGTKDLFYQKCPNHDPRKKQKGRASMSDSKDAKCYYCKTGEDEHKKGAIQCDYCNDWFHITCCNITMEEAQLIEKFKVLGLQRNPQGAADVWEAIRKAAPRRARNAERCHYTLAGERRKVVGKELMLKKPTRLRAEMFADADKEAMAHGNHTQVKSLGVLQHLRTETTAQGDFARAVWPDLVMTMHKQREDARWLQGKKKMSGLIQSEL
ncbi:unnamed protein product [Allacma fusca]|uniref:PHD-type domain-containing protein n=1 Tax=Allacma fusca TaxID=39272 RepID=A0A8J2K4I7_9HEXA|nr:unnamed protein product [Allacma fusca]